MNTKRTTAFTALTALTVVFFAVGCPESTFENTEERDTVAKVSDPAAILWDEELAGFRSWELMPGTTEQMTGRGWHTALATVRGNALALAAVADGTEEIPVGAILVKENFDESGTLVNIVVMKRQKSGWFWAQYLPGGFKESSGPDLSSCVSCHGMAPNDRVFTWIKKVPSAN